MNNLEEINAEIQRRNVIFQAATPSEKRVLVAKDALEQIRKGIYCPRNMTYCLFDQDIKKVINGLGIEKTENPSIQPALFTANQCQCCAFGALVVSTIRYQNQFFLNDCETNNGLIYASCQSVIRKTGIGNIFSSKQLELIEDAFEGFEKHSLSYLFYEKYPNAEKRLVAILENIVENKGEFIP